MSAQRLNIGTTKTVAASGIANAPAWFGVSAREAFMSRPTDGPGKTARSAGNVRARTRTGPMATST
jgi:hypothetical protein